MHCQELVIRLQSHERGKGGGREAENRGVGDEREKIREKEHDEGREMGEGSGEGRKRRNELIDGER